MKKNLTIDIEELKKLAWRLINEDDKNFIVPNEELFDSWFLGAPSDMDSVSATIWLAAAIAGSFRNFCEDIE